MATNIGIDLGKYEIKIAKVDEVNPGSATGMNYLKEYESYPVNVEMYSEDYFKLVKKAIKDFGKKIKKSRLSLNFVLSSNEGTNVLFANLPIVSDKDLEMGMKFEIEQKLALENPGEPIPDFEYTYKIIEEHVELNQYEVLIATLSTSILTKLSKFKTIAWRVNKIMLQPILLERFAKGNDVVIDLGYNETRIHMYKEGRLSEVQYLNFGSADVETVIEGYLNREGIKSDEEVISIMDKLHVKNDFIEIEDDIAEELSDEIDPIISKLMDEVKRTVRTFELENGLDMDEIYYTGGLFNKLNYLDSKIEGEFDFNVEPLNIVSKDIEDVKYDMAGLASLSTRTTDKMDFVQHIRANVDYPSILIAALTVSLSVAIALFLMSGQYESTIEEQQGNMSMQQSEISQIDSFISQSNQNIDRNQRFLDKIESLKNQSKWLSDILFILPDEVPTSVFIKDLDIRDGLVTIDGYSADYSAIGFFANAMDKHGEVEIQSIEEFNNKKNELDDDGNRIPIDGGGLYSVVTDTPDNISDKFFMSKKFRIILTHGPLDIGNSEDEE